MIRGFPLGKQVSLFGGGGLRAGYYLFRRREGSPRTEAELLLRSGTCVTHPKASRRPTEVTSIELPALLPCGQEPTRECEPPASQFVLLALSGYALAFRLLRCRSRSSTLIQVYGDRVPHRNPHLSWHPVCARQPAFDAKGGRAGRRPLGRPDHQPSMAGTVHRL